MNKPAKHPLAGRLATVTVERNGACVEIADVPAEQAGAVFKALLDLFRNAIASGYDELIPPGPDCIPGSQTDYQDDDDFVYQKPKPPARVGF